MWNVALKTLVFFSRSSWIWQYRIWLSTLFSSSSNSSCCRLNSLYSFWYLLAWRNESQRLLCLSWTTVDFPSGPLTVAPLYPAAGTGSCFGLSPGQQQLSALPQPQAPGPERPPHPLTLAILPGGSSRLLPGGSTAAPDIVWEKTKNKSALKREPLLLSENGHHVNENFTCNSGTRSL